MTEYNEVALLVSKEIENEFRKIWNGDYPDDLWPEDSQQELYDLLNSASYSEVNQETGEAIYYWSEIEWNCNKHKGVKVIREVLEDYGEESYIHIIVYNHNSYIVEGYMDGKSFGLNLKIVIEISDKK